LSYIAEAITQIRQGDFESAAKILSGHLRDEGMRPDSKLSLMEWIADCYAKSQNRREAGRWFELAAEAARDCRQMAEYQRKRKAVYELSQALECYLADNNVEGIRRVSRLKYLLNPPRC
jgi:hypothetical protein